MATQYQENLRISAGVDFSEDLKLINPDQTPLDITGYTFYANLAKHENAINALETTSANNVYKVVPMAVTIDNAAGGIISISIPAATTAKLEEGKYVYSVVSQDGSGNREETHSGLAFVEVAFGYSITLGTTDPNYP